MQDNPGRSSSSPEEIDAALPLQLSLSERAQLRGLSLAVLEPSDFYGVALYFRKQRPPGRVSLAEVPLPPKSREWLLNWPRAVSFGSVQSALENDYLDPARGLRPSESLGLVVLWFAAEFGREEATEGEIWTCVAPAFAKDVRNQLFLSGGHPRPALKAAIERCCTRFDLRHAFGREGAQAYYQTVYLQFGFTRRGLQQLESWFAGATVPRAVETLKSECPAFAQLWTDLKRVLDGKASVDLVRGRPFLPRGWVPEPGRLTSPVRLEWTGQGEVTLLVSLQELFGVVCEGQYELTDDSGLWLWISVGERGYEPAHVEVGPAPRTFLLRNLDGGQDGLSAQVALPEDDVLLWDEVGALRRPGALPRRDWTVRVSSDWRVLSPVSRWVRCGLHTYHRIQEGPLVLADEDGCELCLELAENPLGPIKLRLDEAVIKLLPSEVTGVICQVPDGCRVQSTVTTAGSGELTEYLQDFEVRLPVSASLETPRLSVRVRARQGGRSWTRTLAHPLELDLITWNRAGNWETFEDLRQGEVAHLESVPFRFFLRTEVGLLEGNHFLGRPPTRTAPLSGLAGLGAPLLLRPGPYNSSGRDRVLVHSLVNQGLCLKLKLQEERFHMVLRRPICPDSDFTVVWWDGVTEPRFCPIEEYCEERREISGYRPFSHPAAVALGFRGLRLGAIWKGLRLSGPSGFPNLEDYFSFLRWLQLPFLEWTWLNVLQDLVRGHQGEALKAWLTERDLRVAGQTLRQRDPERMLPVARELLSQTDWDVQQALELLRDIPYANLLHVHPTLLLRLLERARANQEIGMIYRELLPAEGMSLLLSRAAEEMGVDPKWVELCCERFLSGDKPDDDLRLALSCHRFQELVTVLALE